MAFDKQTSNILRSIFNNCGLIQSEYKKVINGEFSSERMISLLDTEKNLYDALELSEYEYIKVIFEITKKLNGVADVSIPNGFDLHLNDKTYSLFRMYAHLRHAHMSKEENDIHARCVPVFLELEIGLFYKLLNDFIVKNSAEKEKLYNLSYMILIDSPLIERQIVENHMYPLDEIDDAVDLQIDLWGATYIIKRFGLVGKLDRESYEKIRVKRYITMSEGIFELLGYYMQLADTGQNVILEMEMSVAYLKSLIACQHEEVRQMIYKNYIDRKIMDENTAFFKELVDDIENRLVPSTRKISITNEKYTL